MARRSTSSEQVELDYDYVDSRRSAMTPEQRLIAGMLRRAIWDFALYKDDPTHPNYEFAVDAAGWIFFEGEELDPGDERLTFIEACNMLGLDYQNVRREAVKLTRAQIEKMNRGIEMD